MKFLIYCLKFCASIHSGVTCKQICQFNILITNSMFDNCHCSESLNDAKSIGYFANRVFLSPKLNYWIFLVIFINNLKTYCNNLNNKFSLLSDYVRTLVQRQGQHVVTPKRVSSLRLVDASGAKYMRCQRFVLRSNDIRLLPKFTKTFQFAYKIYSLVTACLWQYKLFGHLLGNIAQDLEKGHIFIILTVRVAFYLTPPTFHMFTSKIICVQ